MPDCIDEVARAEIREHKAVCGEKHKAFDKLADDNRQALDRLSNDNKENHTLLSKKIDLLHGKFFTLSTYINALLFTIVISLIVYIWNIR